MIPSHTGQQRRLPATYTDCLTEILFLFLFLLQLRISIASFLIRALPPQGRCAMNMPRGSIIAQLSLGDAYVERKRRSLFFFCFLTPSLSCGRKDRRGCVRRKALVGRGWVRGRGTRRNGQLELRRPLQSRATIPTTPEATHTTQARWQGGTILGKGLCAGLSAHHDKTAVPNTERGRPECLGPAAQHSA